MLEPSAHADPAKAYPARLLSDAELLFQVQIVKTAGPVMNLYIPTNAWDFGKKTENVWLTGYHTARDIKDIRCPIVRKDTVSGVIRNFDRRYGRAWIDMRFADADIVPVIQTAGCMIVENALFDPKPAGPSGQSR